MCERGISEANNYSICTKCSSSFHKDCIEYDCNTENFICTSYTNEMLPHSFLDDVNLTDDEISIETLVNAQYNIKRSLRIRR